MYISLYAFILISQHLMLEIILSLWSEVILSLWYTICLFVRFISSLFLQKLKVATGHLLGDVPHLMLTITPVWGMLGLNWPKIIQWAWTWNWISSVFPQRSQWLYTTVTPEFIGMHAVSFSIPLSPNNWVGFFKKNNLIPEHIHIVQ